VTNLTEWRIVVNLRLRIVTDPKLSPSKTTLVLLPGLDGTEVFFGPLLSHLPDWVNPLVVTYPTTGANDYPELLKLIEEAIEDCEQFYLLGWSFSGPLALMLAARNPAQVRGVILCASFIRPPHAFLPWLRFAASPPVIHLMRLAHRTPLFLLREPTDPLYRDKATTLARVPSAVLAARARAILTLDARACLRECPEPVLYLAGSRDLVVPRKNFEDVVRHSPSAKVVIIDGPHLALYTNPQAAVHAIVEYIESTNSRPD
jgi:pimeloyl-[acyl-carrier protein] methyl ester esterase